MSADGEQSCPQCVHTTDLLCIAVRLQTFAAPSLFCSLSGTVLVPFKTRGEMGVGRMTEEEKRCELLGGAGGVVAHEGLDVGVAHGAIVDEDAVAQSDDPVDLVDEGEFVGGHHQSGSVVGGLIEES